MNKWVIVGVVVGLLLQALGLGVIIHENVLALKKFEEGANISANVVANYQSLQESRERINKEDNDSEEVVKEVGDLPQNQENVDIEIINKGITSNNITEIEGRKNILLIGVDSRSDDFSGRSDTILLLSLSKNGSYLVSIPRDSYVFIKKKGKYDKINHSYAYGGVDSLKETVSHLLGVKIDNYAIINFSNFIKVIDSIGGVEVNVPFSFSEKGIHGEIITFTEGTQALNGDEALAYVRMRKQDRRGDVGRNDRQKQVILGVVNKVLTVEGIKNIIPLYNSYKKFVKTDFSLIDIGEYMGYITEINKIKNVTLHGKGMKIKGIYYMDLDKNTLNITRELLKK